jgi:misacylated tRNA(Ala) deacylase
MPTTRLYLNDDHRFDAPAIVVATREDALAFDQTCFYPGGGGQPSDEGMVRLANGRAFEVAAVKADAEDMLWHIGGGPIEGEWVGQQVALTINSPRRIAFSRYHTVLHVLNTIVLREHGGWITGAQIATDYSRIDFKLDTLTAALCADLEQKVNGVLMANHALRSYYLPEAEFAQRPDLLRTLEVKPPVYNGQVRVVEIEGFESQACGGTHVDRTAEVGKFSITKTENKGKINKRLYIKLE